MAISAINREQFAGQSLALASALALHVILLALLVLHTSAAPLPALPGRISVTLTDQVGLTSTVPAPQSESLAAAQAAPDVAPAFAPNPVPASPPEAPAKIPPRDLAMPKPLPVPLAKIAPQPRIEPDVIGQLVNRSPARRLIPRPSRASAIGNDFLKGLSAASANGAAHNPPAAAIGPAVQASLAGVIGRQLKPHWTAPQGAEAEKLVTLVRFRLARDGTLIGPPEVVGQSGVTPANAAQKQLHAEQAIRAVRLAAPFDLPDEYYSAWSVVTSRFDRRLSQ